MKRFLFFSGKRWLKMSDVLELSKGCASPCVETCSSRRGISENIMTP